MLKANKYHFPEYLMEAAGLGIFMISAATFTVLFEHPDSPLFSVVTDPFIRRVFIGLAIGLTALGLIYSPWGKQSGAHFNPAVTLTFFRLKKVTLTDTFFYILFQTIGGTLGIYISAIIFSGYFRSDPVNYITTTPGPQGVAIAFIAEFIISFILMSVILFFTNKQRLARFTGVAAGILLLIFISFEAPFSGMSINPARSFASAFPSDIWIAYWIYLTAPVAGMLLAAEIYLKFKKRSDILCAKLHHHNDKRCIFINCKYKEGQLISN